MNIQVRYLLIFSLILGLAGAALALPSGSVSVAHAQTNYCDDLPEIEYGDSMTGTITDDAYIYGYCFEGEAGDEVRIDLSATSNNLDTYAYLYDTSLETIFAENDDSRGTDSQIIYVLPEDGTYLVIATRYDLEAGTSDGDFVMSLSLEGSGQPVPVFDYPVVGEGIVDDEAGVFVTCDTGERIRGGVQFSFININPGLSYTATVVGLDGFDPVLAVKTQPGIGTCNDDESRADRSTVVVPEEGATRGGSETAQVRFTTPGRGFPVNITVGSFNDEPGRFVLVIEGLVIQPADELDGFSIRVPAAVAEEPLGVYMVSRYTDLDPAISVGAGPGLTRAYVDGEFDPELVNFDNIAFPLYSCDDAGRAECDFTPPLPAATIDITNGSSYNTGSVDAGLMLIPNTTEPLLYAFGSSQSASTGTYAIIIIGNVPGDD